MLAPSGAHERRDIASTVYDARMRDIDVRNVIRIASWIVASAFAAYLVLSFVRLPDVPGIFLARDFLDPNAEQSVVTWFSSILWLLGAATATLIGAARNHAKLRDAWWWYAFALVPLAISIDEVAAMHERLSAPVRARLELDGALYFAWVLPVGLLALVLGVVFSRFLLRLPAWLRGRILIAAAVSVAGGIGVELVGSAIFRMEDLGRHSAPYVVASTIEESLEIVGSLILLAGLLRYLATHTRRVTILLEDVPRDTRAPSERA